MKAFRFVSVFIRPDNSKWLFGCQFFDCFNRLVRNEILP